MATLVAGITPKSTRKKLWSQALAAMDSCFGLVRSHQHGIANTWAQGSHRKTTSNENLRQRGHSALPSFSSKLGHVTEKHVIILCQGDMFDRQTFEVWSLLEHVSLKWRVTRKRRTPRKCRFKIFFSGILTGTWENIPTSSNIYANFGIETQSRT